MSEAITIGTARAVVIAALLVVGTFFLLVGTIGLLRLPNVYNRMHATSKAATLGASSILLANVVYYGPGGAGLTSLVGILFLFLTAPTGAHVVSRAAQKMGIDFIEPADWPGRDEESGPAPTDDD
jgi:multicomponent Na+:H+ antiporter subunit G